MMTIGSAASTHTLTNGTLTIGVKNAGAELTSIASKKTGLEYLWQANPAFWGKHAPVLFPIVGRLKNDSYTYGGRTYHMNQHGLARTMDFEMFVKTDTMIQFRLRHDEATLARYPFTFELIIGYTLENDHLHVGYEVVNRGTDPLFFSIGAHPGFRCPLTPDECYEDYYLVTDGPARAERHFLEDGLIARRTEPFLEGRREIPIARDLFHRDAIVLKDVRFSQVSLLSRKTGHGVTMDMKGFPYFGIWAKSGADFVCLEPWYGIADGIDASGRLEDKEGIMKLAADAAFSAVYTITPR